MDGFRASLEEGLRVHRLHYVSSTAMGTPRRLTVWINGLSEQQEDKTKSLSASQSGGVYPAGEPQGCHCIFKETQCFLQDLLMYERRKENISAYKG